MSREDAPTRSSKAPASTTQARVSSSHVAKARRSSESVTESVAPGSRATLANALSSCSGRSTVDSTSWTYTCTTSLPARPPVLVTLTRTVTMSPATVTSGSDHSKVV